MTLRLGSMFTLCLMSSTAACANGGKLVEMKDASMQNSRADGGHSSINDHADAASGSSGGARDAGSDAGESDAHTPSGSSGDISCDTRALRCRIAEPSCPQGSVPEVKDGCYGACVKIESCSCTEQAACPHTEQYACFMFAQHCGPYVN